MSDTNKHERSGFVLKIVVSALACLVLLGGAAATSYMIFQTEPTAQREGATKKTAALVETVQAELGTYTPRLRVLGVVEAAQEIDLSPRVGGIVFELDENVVPGGIVERESELLKIDPRDYENELAMLTSAMRQVEAELAIEEGRQQVARREYELLGEEISEENQTLVLREPQIASIRARLRAAEAAVDRAERDLEETSILAPFDAQVMDRMVNVGSRVAPRERLAHLVGIDEYWVTASVPMSDLRRIRFGDAQRSGSRVTIRHSSWGADETRVGRVSRLIGSLDEQTRLARVQIVVKDPLARETSGQPLILGSIVQLQIEAEPIGGVVRIPRELLRQNSTVWVYADGVLDIRSVGVEFRDAEGAYISSGLEDGDMIVTTNLATVRAGLPLQIDDGGGAGDDAGGSP